jgi:hypothetical protein
MKLRIALLLCVCAVSSVVSAQQNADLFIAPNDVARALRILPRLAEATHKGTGETRAFLVSQELSYERLQQVLMSVSVAYTAIRLEEYLKQVEPLVDDKSKDSQYRNYVTQARKQLTDLTAKYERAKKDGRSALEVNKEYVMKNRAAVEELMLHMRSMNVDSLPKSEAPPKE